MIAQLRRLKRKVTNTLRSLIDLSTNLAGAEIEPHVGISAGSVIDLGHTLVSPPYPLYLLYCLTNVAHSLPYLNYLGYVFYALTSPWTFTKQLLCDKPLHLLVWYSINLIQEILCYLNARPREELLVVLAHRYLLRAQITLCAWIDEIPEHLCYPDNLPDYFDLPVNGPGHSNIHRIETSTSIIAVKVQRNLDNHVSPSVKFSQFLAALVVCNLRHEHFLHADKLVRRGGLFVCMRWVDGVSSREYIQTCRRQADRMWTNARLALNVRKPLDVHQELVGRILLQVAQAVNYLHQRGIVHGNIRALKIIIDHGSPLLIPSGRSGFICAKVRKDDSYYQWLAPETIVGDGDFFALFPTQDVYSIGVLCWELWTMGTPYHGYYHMTPDRVFDGERPLQPLDMPVRLWELIKRCWAHEPLVRPTMEQVVVELQGIAASE